MILDLLGFIAIIVFVLAQVVQIILQNPVLTELDSICERL